VRRLLEVLEEGGEVGEVQVDPDRWMGDLRRWLVREKREGRAREVAVMKEVLGVLREAVAMAGATSIPLHLFREDLGDSGCPESSAGSLGASGTFGSPMVTSLRTPGAAVDQENPTMRAMRAAMARPGHGRAHKAESSVVKTEGSEEGIGTGGSCNVEITEGSGIDVQTGDCEVERKAGDKEVHPKAEESLMEDKIMERKVENKAESKVSTQSGINEVESKSDETEVGTKLKASPGQVESYLEGNYLGGKEEVVEVVEMENKVEASDSENKLVTSNLGNEHKLSEIEVIGFKSVVEKDTGENEGETFKRFTKSEVEHKVDGSEVKAVVEASVDTSVESSGLVTVARVLGAREATTPLGSCSWGPLASSTPRSSISRESQASSTSNWLLD